MKMNLKQQIANRIRLAREKQGLSQVQIVALTGIARQTMSDYEKANIFPSVQNSIKLCKALHVSLNWLLTGDDTMDTTNEQEKEFSAEEIEMLIAFRKATKPRRQIALEVLKNVTQDSDRIRHNKQSED